MTDFDINFLSHNRKPVCPPDPSFPHGKDFDAAPDAKVACVALLPYPAECCGVWMVECKSCGLRVGITAAGRPDDPRSVKLACKRSAGAVGQHHAADLDEEVGALRGKVVRLADALEHAIDRLVRLNAYVNGQGYRPAIRGTVALGRAALSLANVGGSGK